MQKRNDGKGRWRNKIVSFRMSEQEWDELNTRVKLSGLSKQDYLIMRCFEKDIVVVGNPRVYKALRDEMNSVLVELKRVSDEALLSDELLDRLELITVTMEGLAIKNSYPAR
ncbi:plasmid mobilization protein [Vallitalea guaymasensis]|uniref:Mobilization protein n=1 Tax=Vallitalea guaymasensis TaxID=1185412 RepID=A0A8J8SAR6_9FIRM|nr:hypothetical protein [Vallitalea guaymasensis]QUH27566.1 hypothetical protein HYG85_00985 [Vallitalea guaymasensis]